MRIAKFFESVNAGLCNGFHIQMVTSLHIRSGGDPIITYYCDGLISPQSDSGDSYIKCCDGEEHDR